MTQVSLDFYILVSLQTQRVFNLYSVFQSIILIILLMLILVKMNTNLKVESVHGDSNKWFVYRIDLNDIKQTNGLLIELI